MFVCEKRGENKQGKQVYVDVFASTSPLRCAYLIGLLTLDVKLQDHPGEKDKGFLSCFPACNLSKHRFYP